MQKEAKINLSRNNMYHSLLYILLFIVILTLFIIGYIKVKFKFWSIQPVFHVYDAYYYFFYSGIIQHELPEKNKYCNFKHIETLTYSKNMNDNHINQFISFIIVHYLQNNENKFIPDKKNIVPYFEGHNQPCYFSFYYKDEYFIDEKTSQSITNKKILSVMTTRPTHVFIRDKNLSFNAYYVDYLCVDKYHRKSGIAPEIIQTHEYNQRHLNKQIQVSLFKREGELTGIVPVTVYSTYGFSMIKWKKPKDFDANLHLIEVGPTNMHHLLDYIKEKSGKFDICITTETSNLNELIKTKNIFVYMIIQEDQVIACYFFRKTNTFIKKNVEAVCCFASISSTNSNFFSHGYKCALWKICTSSKTLGYAVIESISDNIILYENLKKRTTPEIVSPTAYFFYNFAYHTFNSDKVFIIN